MDLSPFKMYIYVLVKEMLTLCQKRTGTKDRSIKHRWNALLAFADA